MGVETIASISNSHTYRGLVLAVFTQAETTSMSVRLTEWKDLLHLMCSLRPPPESIVTFACGNKDIYVALSPSQMPSFNANMNLIVLRCLEFTSARSASCTSLYLLRWAGAATADGSCAFSHFGYQYRRRTGPSSPRKSSLLCLNPRWKKAYIWGDEGHIMLQGKSKK